MGGVCERFPELKLLVLESGGGWAASILERMDEEVEANPQEARWLTMHTERVLPPPVLDQLRAQRPDAAPSSPTSSASTASSGRRTSRTPMRCTPVPSKRSKTTSRRSPTTCRSAFAAPTRSRPTGWTWRANRPAAPRRRRHPWVASRRRAAAPSRSRPRETQLRLSAQASIGGSTTSALSSATATFIATMRPKSRSSGNDENDSTATPGDRGQARDHEGAPGPRGRDVDGLLRVVARGAAPRRSATGSAT